MTDKPLRVYAALYCPCTYESDYGVLSLHFSKKEAQAAIDRHRRRESRKYAGELPGWVKHTVRQMKVKP